MNFLCHPELIYTLQCTAPYEQYEHNIYIFVGESQSDTQAIEQVVSGCVQLVLITPESIISNPRYRSVLLSKTYQQKLVALVVDEAHCVKTW